MTADNVQLAQLFLDCSRRQLLEQSWPRLRTCVESLTDEQIWWRPNEASNSIGNLLLHLNGNLGQWLVASFSREDDTRNRPAEFAAQGGNSAAELLERLGATVEKVGAVLERATPDDLAATFTVQGYTVSGMEAIYHAIEHFALHYGQIAYITKSLNNQDLGFYRHLNKASRA